jgi:hypothetical protein
MPPRYLAKIEVDLTEFPVEKPKEEKKEEEPGISPEELNPDPDE